MFSKSFYKEIHSIAKLIVTCFGIGYFPKIPGTIASLITLVVAWFIIDGFGKIYFALIILALFFLGWFSSYCVLKSKRNGHDPQFIVIDEVVGQGLVLLSIPGNPLMWIVSFALFRYFDIAKTWPIHLLEKTFKNAFGIMIDDIGAALYAILTTNIFFALLAFYTVESFSK
ncbi:MAG: phosphatidylglycerophosphatase A [Pseudomonadota bacterium]|nr:phosphatidylglycerophosphatase A [Pseudomonadota bacterium]